MPPIPGTLYIVATPIGNLEDLTFRGLRILREVDLIAAEDTRRTSKLLAHYEIRKPLTSVREHNEAHESERLVAKLIEGLHIALVTDAGTPGIADPGARLVRVARQRGIPVVPIPGASAISAALSVSGLEGREFVFMGFPPPAGTERRQWFDRLAMDERIVVLFEAPHRVRKTLSELTKLVERPIIVNRELTKRHEELVVCTINKDIELVREQGEFTIIVGPAARGAKTQPDSTEVAYLFGCLTNSCGYAGDAALNVISLVYAVSQSEAAKIVKKHRIKVKQSNNSTA